MKAGQGLGELVLLDEAFHRSEHHARAGVEELITALEYWSAA
jgi:hypothetical protein